MMKKPTPPWFSSATVSPGANVRSWTVRAIVSSSRGSSPAKSGTCLRRSVASEATVREILYARLGFFDPLRELLDPALGRVEPLAAELVELLAALPERERLVEGRLPVLEALDDLLELLLCVLERLLAHRVSSTIAPKPPSASWTTTREPV